MLTPEGEVNAHHASKTHPMYASTTTLRVNPIFQAKSSEYSLPLTEFSNSDGEHPPFLPTETILPLRTERLYLATICWCMFLTGWGAGILGPLLPTIQSHYQVNYTVVSMLFVALCCGTIVGSMTSSYLTRRHGFGKLMAFGAALQLGTSAALIPAPDFPLFCVIFAINGLAGSFQMASCNVFVASLPRNGPTNLGIMHAAFGAGALFSPLAATQFAQVRHWSFSFFTLVGLAIINTISVLLVFKWKRQEDLVSGSLEQEADEDLSKSVNSLKPTCSKLTELIRLPKLHFMLLFIFVYVGVEITVGGWIVTFLQRHRGGGAATGYVSSGFFGGLMLGRLVLLPLNKMIGAKRAVIIYTIISIGLELIVWLVPSLVADAIAVSLVGMFIGPFYPILIEVASRKLPKELLGDAIGLISAVGQTGAAVFPFLNGALASKFGVQTMQPLIVSMLAVLVLAWIPIAKSPKA